MRRRRGFWPAAGFLPPKPPPPGIRRLLYGEQLDGFISVALAAESGRGARPRRRRILLFFKEKPQDEVKLRVLTAAGKLVRENLQQAARAS